MSEAEPIIAGIKLSSPDKILYPEQGITKRDLADHMVAMAPVMLKHVAMRPITLVRCPTGRQKKCFYQRHAGAGISRHVERVTVPGFDNPYIYIKDLSGLVALVQMGVLEIHPWNVRVEQAGCADRLIFDLDPSEELGFVTVVDAALEIKDRLDRLGLVSFAKTTGGKGLHVVVPVEPDHEWPVVKAWAKAFSERMAADSPELYLIRLAKAERTGRLFIDYLRNDPTATAVAPYSPRAREDAPVAMPLPWEAVTQTLDPKHFTVPTAADFIAGRDDPWEEMESISQRLPERPD